MSRRPRGRCAASFHALACATVVLSGCEPRAERIGQPRPVSELVQDYVAIGDGFSAGAQSGALAKRHQMDSYPAILASHFGVSLTPTSAMTQPLIANPGFPIARPVVPAGYLDVVDLSPLTLARTAWDDPDLVLRRDEMHDVMELNRTQAFPFRNLSVPGAFAYDVRFAVDSLTTWTAAFAGEPNYLFESVLRLGREDPASPDSSTLLDDALSRSPSLTTVWLRTSEILTAAASGGGALPYDAATFGAHLGAILDSLLSIGSAIAIGTIPDVTRLPFFDALPRVVTGGDGTPISHPRTEGFVPLLGEGGPPSDLQSGVTTLAPGTQVLLDAVRPLSLGAGVPDAILVARIAETEHVDEATARARLPERYPAHGTPLEGRLTLTPDERAGIAAAVDAYNVEITGAALIRGAALVDLDALFAVFDRGLSLGGVPLDDGFVTGGLVSLDGLHPTSLGYALIAARFAEVINATFDTDVPAIDVGRYLDPPTLPEIGPARKTRRRTRAASYASGTPATAFEQPDRGH